MRTFGVRTTLWLVNRYDTGKNINPLTVAPKVVTKQKAQEVPAKPDQSSK